MKEGKQDCAKPQPPPRPNIKNKDFVKWTKAESCKKEDCIVSTDWHERLQKTPVFIPVYDNEPSNMVYLLSGEYGRMWQKERDDWYSKVFVLAPKDQDMDNRIKKIRKEAREAKKAADLKIQERKVRRAKEAEAKAKADLEKAEKLKAKIRKCSTKKKPKKQETKSKIAPAESAVVEPKKVFSARKRKISFSKVLDKPLKLIIVNACDFLSRHLADSHTCWHLRWSQEHTEGKT